MFLYVYGDHFGLYRPGVLKAMEAGRMGPLGQATPGVLLGVSALMAVPSLMVFLSLVLPAAVCRWASIVLGLFYTAVVLATTPGAPPYYLLFSAIEVILSLALVWQAWRWPRAAIAFTLPPAG